MFLSEFVLVLFFVFYPRRNKVFGEVVDVLAPAIDNFSGYSLAALPKFEIVMMGLILVLSCSVREEVGEEGEEG